MRLSIIIPCFNESGNVERVADDLAVLGEAPDPPPELIFVDNGSHDRTREILDRIVKSRPNCRMVALDLNRGYGGGILAGMDIASGDVVAIGTGDAQVRGEDFQKAWALMRSGDYDYVKAYRIARQDGSLRRSVSLCYNWAFQWLFGPVYRDINGPIKMMRKSLWDSLNLVCSDWFIDAEIALKVRLRPDIRIADFPVDWFRRESGRSQVRWTSVLEFARNMILARVAGIGALEARYR